MKGGSKGSRNIGRCDHNRKKMDEIFPGSNIVIRNMKREEVSFAIDMAVSEGWNHGIHDGGIFYDTDPEGFFIAEMNEKFLGSASAVTYGASFGFMGFYVVTPECRGKGIGMALMNACLAYLDRRIIGIDGVLENELNIRREWDSGHFTVTCVMKEQEVAIYRMV